MAREKQTRRSSDVPKKLIPRSAKPKTVTKPVPSTSMEVNQDKAKTSTKISPDPESKKATNADLVPKGIISHDYKKYRMTVFDMNNRDDIWGQRRFDTILECADFVNSVLERHGINKVIHHNAIYDIGKYNHSNIAYYHCRYEILNKDGTIRETRQAFPKLTVPKSKKVLPADFSDTELEDEKSDTEGDYSVSSDDVTERLEELQNQIDTEKREEAFKDTVPAKLSSASTLLNNKKPEEKTADELVDEYQPSHAPTVPAVPIPEVKTPVAPRKIIIVQRPVSYKKNTNKTPKVKDQALKQTPAALVSQLSNEEVMNKFKSIDEKLAAINNLLIKFLSQK